MHQLSRLTGPAVWLLKMSTETVLRLLRTDLSGPDIARELMVSLNTMRTHTKNIYTKLGVDTQIALYPNEGHGVGRQPKHTADYHARALAWFDKYLK